MTPEALIPLLSGHFHENFADTVAARILAEDAAETLYAAATSKHTELPAAVRHKVLFRSAYVLERIFFAAPERFRLFEARFVEHDFSACDDASARRHFAKIMAHLLPRMLAASPDCFYPSPPYLDHIAEAAAEWVAAPGAKVGMQVWAVEILRCCRPHVGWVAEMWDDLLEMLSAEATPGIASRMRRNWRRE